MGASNVCGDGWVKFGYIFWLPIILTFGWVGYIFIRLSPQKKIFKVAAILAACACGWVYVSNTIAFGFQTSCDSNNATAMIYNASLVTKLSAYTSAGLYIGALYVRFKKSSTKPSTVRNSKAS
jgi:hypothetical protein